jgi:hypothetical protein
LLGNEYKRNNRIVVRVVSYVLLSLRQALSQIACTGDNLQIWRVAGNTMNKSRESRQGMVLQSGNCVRGKKLPS